MSDLKAIETLYKGYRFRSRLEARWAVFFDAIGMKWKYETEGFDIDGRWYLPDFFIEYERGNPGWGFWIEIKPSPLDESQVALLDGLARITGHRTFAICGDPWPGEYAVSVFDHYHNRPPANVPLWSGMRFGAEGLFIDTMNVLWWRYGLTWDDAPFGSRLQSFAFPERNYRKGEMQDAFSAARSARFEHGESP